MAALTTLGIIHTAISLVAVGSGIVSLARTGNITWKNGVGKTYIVTTILTCLTGFGIYQHGGFGKPHILGIITLVVIAIAYAGDRQNLGRASKYVAAIGYSMTFFFHFIPAVTETTTRLPVSAPLAAGPDDPLVQKLVGICFLLFLIGTTLQVIKLRSKSGAGGGVAA
ncbi:DUF2306 domain-containing protein [Deminuibacter soli]|uniref:DUF2306 domain-containing protein n=1 Tax=Deminuibacter soli TaxID=2291815 RepID=A0A3E1NKJ3_9BACT|nr:hypothetical protein [Deminuibacter soli]RFM28308.1 hypothetical protein DXN05_12415 [Deminuibacter soli]